MIQSNKQRHPNLSDFLKVEGIKNRCNYHKQISPLKKKHINKCNGKKRSKQNIKICLVDKNNTNVISEIHKTYAHIQNCKSEFKTFLNDKAKFKKKEKYTKTLLKS